MNAWKKIISALLLCAMLFSSAALCVVAEESEAGELPPYEEYSERFDGKSLADVVIADSKTPKSAMLKTAYADSASHGSVIQWNLEPKGDALYYLLSSDKRSNWPFTEHTIGDDGKLSGTANGIKVTNATINTTSPTTTVTVGGTSYYVATAALADAQSGMIGNVSLPLYFRNDQFRACKDGFTVSFDIYLSNDFKNVKGFTGRIAVKDKGTGSVRFELFNITQSNGSLVFEKHTNAEFLNGITSGVSIEAGQWHTITLFVNTVTTEEEGTYPLVEAYLDGKYAYTARNKESSMAIKDKASYPLTPVANTLQMEINRMGNPGDLGGFCQIDNMLMYHGEPELPAASDDGYLEGFASFDVGEKPESLFFVSAGASTLAPMKDTVVSDTYGSKAWKIPMDAENTAIKARLIHDGYSAETYKDPVTIGASYFIDPEAKGALQMRFDWFRAYVGEGATAFKIQNKGLTLFQLAFAGDGKVTLGFEDAGTNPTVKLPDTAEPTLELEAGMWLSVDCVFDLPGGTYDIYVNGQLKYEDLSIYKGADRLFNIDLQSNRFIPAIIPTGHEYAGAVYMDNIKISTSAGSSAAEDFREDFESYANRVGYYLRGADVPMLAKYASVDGTTAIALELGTGPRADGYAMLEANGDHVFAYDVEFDPSVDDTSVYVPDGYISDWTFDVQFDEEKGLYYSEIPLGYADAPEYHTYYLVPNVVAASAFAGNNVGVGFRVAHGAYSAATTEKVIFGADYFFENGSTGTVGSFLKGFTYGVCDKSGSSEITFWSADAATGQVTDTDAFFKIGAWNNVKIVLDLRAGTYDLYLNDRLIASRDSGYKNMIFGLDASSQWNAFVSVPHGSITGMNDGMAYIDNVCVDTNVPEGRSQYDESFLSDEAYFDYLSDALVTVQDTTVRLEAPNGLRFATMIDETIYAKITEKFEVVRMGTLITPADIAELAGGTTHALLDALEGDGKYLDIAHEEDFVGAAGVAFGEGRYFTASIVDIKEQNLARDFVGVGYLTIKIDEETTLTFYADGFVANVSDTAADALSRTDVEWTDEQLAILESFIVPAVEK